MCAHYFPNKIVFECKHLIRSSDNCMQCKIDSFPKVICLWNEKAIANNTKMKGAACVYVNVCSSVLLYILYIFC